MLRFGSSGSSRKTTQNDGPLSKVPTSIIERQRHVQVHSDPRLRPRQRRATKSPLQTHCGAGYQTRLLPCTTSTKRGRDASARTEDERRLLRLSATRRASDAPNISWPLTILKVPYPDYEEPPGTN
ncbi:hypothetical protein LSTR_LSTR014122 [Laodelphax striatellus]|uniref:Uncharacterized protein n=1 Tax=Laodelphax striatellus TaxID=195883 RepID=A0A482XHY0_LAOST|nr:hypothetical protein LSTR_LSTR014122 [Laodelphax striatellus]